MERSRELEEEQEACEWSEVSGFIGRIATGRGGAGGGASSRVFRMPLFKRKPYVLRKPPKDLLADEDVFQVRFTKEIFRDYTYPRFGCLVFFFSFFSFSCERFGGLVLEARFFVLCWLL